MFFSFNYEPYVTSSKITSQRKKQQFISNKLFYLNDYRVSGSKYRPYSEFFLFHCVFSRKTINLLKKNDFKFNAITLDNDPSNSLLNISFVLRKNKEDKSQFDFTIDYKNWVKSKQHYSICPLADLDTHFNNQDKTLICLDEICSFNDPKFIENSKFAKFSSKYSDKAYLKEHGHIDYNYLCPVVKENLSLIRCV